MIPLLFLNKNNPINNYPHDYEDNHNEHTQGVLADKLLRCQGLILLTLYFRSNNCVCLAKDVYQ
jgi:hypothetical protein